MSKYAIYTKWYWKDGFSTAEIQNGMKENLLGKTKAEILFGGNLMIIIINL